jgi:hypothetical protein
MSEQQVRTLDPNLPPMVVEPVTLEGEVIRLEPLSLNHVITWSGRIRHSVYYSIIDSEWPDVRAGLEKRLFME